MKSLPYCHAWIVTVFSNEDSNAFSFHLTTSCDGSHQFFQNLDKSVTQEYLYMIGLELLDNWKINLQLWRFSRHFEFFAVRTFRITVEAYIRLEFVEHLCRLFIWYMHCIYMAMIAIDYLIEICKFSVYIYIYIYMIS